MTLVHTRALVSIEEISYFTVVVLVLVLESKALYSLPLLSEYLFTLR